MASVSLLALIDDIATLLDDVSVMTKIAAKKTSGVLGDDLALNAQQVAGVKADRVGGFTNPAYPLVQRQSHHQTLHRARPTAVSRLNLESSVDRYPAFENPHEYWRHCLRSEDSRLNQAR